MRPHRLAALLLLATLFVSNGWGQTHAGARERSSILFLKLKMHQGTVSLLRSTVREGWMKIPRGSPDSSGILYEVVSSNGDVLLRDWLTDPSLRRYEYEDPARPGHLVSRQVKLDDVEFTLRIPYNAGIRRVDFYRLDEPQSNLPLQATSRHSIGTVIPMSEGRLR